MLCLLIHGRFVPQAEIFAIERPQPHEGRPFARWRAPAQNYRMLGDAFGPPVVSVSLTRYSGPTCRVRR